MKLYEFCQQCNMVRLSDGQRKFVAKVILREVNKIAEREGLSHDDAYFRFSRGLYEEALQEIANPPDSSSSPELEATE